MSFRSAKSTNQFSLALKNAGLQTDILTTAYLSYIKITVAKIKAIHNIKLVQNPTSIRRKWSCYQEEKHTRSVFQL
jgi:hypothetical protein